MSETVIEDDKLTEDRIAEIVKDVVSNNNKKFKSEIFNFDEESKKQFKTLFEEDFKAIKAELSKSKEDINEDISSIKEAIKTSNENAGKIGYLTALKAFSKTDAFKQIRNKGQNIFTTIEPDVIISALKNNEIETIKADGSRVSKGTDGINIYGEASDNGYTDYNLFDADTPEEAIDRLWAFINSDNINGIELRKSIIFPYVTVQQTNTNFVTYGEILPNFEDNTFANYKTVKEGGKKPLQTCKLSSDRTDGVKLAKGMAYTMETEMDIPGWVNMVRTLLADEHELAQEECVLKYLDEDNPTSNKNGILNNSTTFDASKVLSVVQSPNLIDAIKACISQISTTFKYQYGRGGKANVCFLNPNTYDYFISMLKDGDNKPLYETDFKNRLKSDYGLSIELADFMPVEKILIGDLKKFNVRPYMPFSIRVGLINDMFIHNQSLTIAESRHIQYIRATDKQYIIYDDIQTIIDALAQGPAPIVNP